ncbi:MAG: acyl-CoA carboxylase subunit beta [Frankiaceae bacterium]|nr:acyl-CoA carboxylase subunit beta [Frankiaceae bacterium]
MTDWRDAVLVGVEPLLASDPTPLVAVEDADPTPLVAVEEADPTDDGPEEPASVAGDTVWVGHGRIGRADVVVASWDFRVHGGSFGERDATAFVAACAEAATTRRPLVSMLRSGGTRLQEGMRALVGIPRALLALDQLARAGVPHIAVADHPSTGGVWVAIGATADLRIGVSGATVGFSGPRVIEAMTGVAVPRGTNTAESAEVAGLLDAVVAPERLATWLENALVTLRPDEPRPTVPPVPVGVPDRSGWQQVERSRDGDRPGGAELLEALLDDSLFAEGSADAPLPARPVHLRCGDDSVSAAVGRLGGHRVVLVALTARRAGRATPRGYGLLSRSAELAGRLDLSCVVLVDTAGADPLPLSEQAGIAPAIAAAMSAMLRCPAPTLAVVHGEGGSGGALAGAVTDCVAITENGWFAALGPEGAAATLRISPEQAADLMGVAPRDLLGSGFADALAPADADGLRAWTAARLDGLRAVEPADRLARRHARWSTALPGSSVSSSPDSPDIA